MTEYDIAIYEFLSLVISFNFTTTYPVSQFTQLVTVHLFIYGFAVFPCNLHSKTGTQLVFSAYQCAPVICSVPGAEQALGITYWVNRLPATID